MLSLETKTALDADIDAEVDKRIRDYPIHVYIDGKELYIDETRIEGGEMFLSSWSPIQTEVK